MEWLVPLPSGDTHRLHYTRPQMQAAQALTQDEAAYALLVSVPALEAMAAECDRHDVLTAEGADLRQLAALFGVDTDA